MKNYFKIIFWQLLIVVFTISGSTAQTSNTFNQRDDTFTLLGLKRAKADFEAAKSEYERQQALFEKGLIDKVALEKMHNRYIYAEVNYQQSLLTVLFEDQYISITKAVKYQGEDGKKHARITFANTSGGTSEFQKLINVDDELFRSLQPDIIPNVYVSILNDNQAIISQPYEEKIDKLFYGKPVEIDFVLLQDLDQVNVSMIYSNGVQRTMKIFLQKDESVDKVLVQSEQFSQEVDLGKATSFDLTLELYSGSSNTFALEVVNLPKQIGRFFKSQNGQVRLTQIKFTESSRTKPAALEISLPDRPSDEVVMDQPIPFYVLILPKDKVGQIKNLRTKNWTEEEIAALEVGFVKLELVPRGKGELRVKTPQLYHAIDRDQSASVIMDLFNEGSDRLDNIEFKVDLPLNWTKGFRPKSISSLEIGDEIRTTMLVTPPQDVAAGKYNIRVRLTSMSNGLPVSAEDKTITIEVNSSTSILGTLFILLLIGGLIFGVIMYGLKLSKK